MRLVSAGPAGDVPPYVIFHDSTLSQMAVEKPQTPVRVLDISGVGQTKLERFGSAFLDALQSHTPDDKAAEA